MFFCNPCKQDVSLRMADSVIDSTTSVDVSGLESPNCASRSNRVCCHGNKSSDCKRDLEIACHNDSGCKAYDYVISLTKNKSTFFFPLGKRIGDGLESG